MSAPPGIVEEARQRTRAKFPLLNVARAFLTLPSGSYSVPGGTSAPHVIRGRSRRKDRKAGTELTYAGLIITEAA